jgi:GNAT superfamily N-acetyltransferase
MENDLVINFGEIDELHEVYSRLEADFDREERKSKQHIENLMLKKKYKLVIARHKISKELIGYAFFHEIDKLKLIWLDYMAVNAEYRNNGYGTLLFRKIIEMQASGMNGVFIEIKIPEEILDLKRIKFYERVGAKKLNIDYIFPNHYGGFPMYLYFVPSPNLLLLSKDVIKDSICSAFQCIHTDVRDVVLIYESFADQVSDEHFFGRE